MKLYHRICVSYRDNVCRQICASFILLTGFNNQSRNHEFWILTNCLFNHQIVFDEKNPKNTRIVKLVKKNCKHFGFVVSELVVGSNEQDIFSKRLDDLRPVSVKLSSIRVAFWLFFFENFCILIWYFFQRKNVCSGK